MKFNLAEKLAVVNVIDSVIHADGVVHEGEITILSKLMQVIDFDSNFIIYARNIDLKQSTLILSSMLDDKKIKLASILEEVAMSDGFVHQKETELLLNIFSSIGIKKCS